MSIDLSDGGACLGEIQVHATDSCNLNCKACTHFSPFVKGRRQINMTQFERDMHRLRELFSSLYVFQLMGGKPLLEPEICIEIIQIVRSYYPECSINLITNGMLIDKMEDKFLSLLRNNDVTIRVSVYPLVVPKVERIKQILRQQGIDFICEISNKVEFEKCFTIKSKSNAYENMRRCHGRGCYSLYQGRFTKCPSAMYARDLAAELKKTDMNGEWLYVNDTIDIYKENDAWSIIERLEEICEFGEHCDVSNMVRIPWEPVQGKPSLADWFLDCE